jgi:sugar/nucleoside kinase (ribokinase family)
MAAANNRKYGILSVGELLIDFISTDFADNLDEVQDFKRLLGGSPANLCMNMARLGINTRLVASIGNDDMGKYLARYVHRLGVDLHGLRAVDEPTTLILVTRSKQVSNFEAYRGADCQIVDAQFPAGQFEDIALFHTTCFALSREPAQSSIMRAARLAAQKGCQLSIDANYARKIWPGQEEAQRLVAEYCSLGALIKMSEVDWERLYNEQMDDPEAAADRLLGLGAREVCLTMGSEGCLAATRKERHFLGTRQIAVKDTTGAGDAFWAGYLTAWLKGKSLLGRAETGRNMAEQKLAHFGPLPDKLDVEQILQTS